VIDGGFLGDFLDWISWGRRVKISPALLKFLARGKIKKKKFSARARKKILAKKSGD
jgi:hypothetical protein